MDVVPRLAVPFRIAGGRAATVEQDSEADVDACVYAVLATELGTRLPEEPEFGVTSPVFRQGGMDLPEVRAALSTWEPRADITTEQQLEENGLVRVRVGVGS